MTLPPGRRDLRLASGLILLVYIAAHLVNHALGLLSIAVAERGLRIAVTLWQSPPPPDWGHEAGRIVVSRSVWVAAQRNLQDLVWRELDLPDCGRISVAWFSPLRPAVQPPSVEAISPHDDGAARCRGPKKMGG